LRRDSTVSYERLREFFDWATRRSFWDLEIRDRHVRDYMSTILTDFGRTENLYKIRDKHGHSLETVVEMLMEAQSGCWLSSG